MSYLSLGVVCLIVPALTWLVLSRLRSPAVAAWCQGSLLGACGLTMEGLGGSLPGWASHTLSNLLGTVGLVLMAQALRHDQGVPWRPRTLAGAALGYLVLHEALRRSHLGGITHALLGAIWLALLLQVAGWALRIARQQGSIGAWAIAASNLLLAAGLLVVFLGPDRGWGGGRVPVRTWLHAELVNSLMAAVHLAEDVGFIGLALEGALRDRSAAVAAQVRTEERQRLGDQLAALDRQRGWGLVAASLAHELNQPLTAILASVQAARRGTEGRRLTRPQLQALLDKAILNARRISGVTARIRAFVRPADLEPGLVDLRRVAQEVLDLLEPDLRQHRVQVDAPAAGAPLLVQGDAIQLSQVVLNVLRNAMEAVQSAPVRSIRILLSGGAGEVLLTICDSGPGLAPGMEHLAGTPFATTKVQGLGLGLSISTAILRVHHGSLSLVPGAEGGACVAIRLPQAGIPGVPA